ncbi:MAG: hypothetical protein HY077_06580 [Elusimicrobia bacterium]|nr:hypothetical protein [Elusimicrobiota bacterium]
MTPSQTASKTKILRATLKGSPRARGRAHGELFGPRVKESGILEFYRGFCGREVFSALPRPAGWALDKLHGLLGARLSPSTAELVAGFAEGAGLDERQVREGLAMPDVLNFLVGLSGRVMSAPTLGCTSAAAWADYTEDGRLLYARNLDFPGNGIWDRFPLVCRHEPDRGIPYVSIGAAGSIADGITGINAEGLSLALHQHYTTELGPWPSGRLILDLGVSVLSSCRDIEEAVELSSSWPATSGWSLVLTHWKKKEAAVIQKTARRTVMRRSVGQSLVHTNTFDDASLRATEVLRPAFYESSRLRKQRAEAILEEKKGRIDAVALASLLNDRLDPERGLVRAFGQAIHQPYTVTSVVMDPERGLLWVSEGAAPVCEGPYRSIRLWDDAEPGETLSPADPLPPAKREAYGRYLNAYGAWSDRRDAAAAGAELDSAIKGDGDDPIYRHMRGLMALKTGELKTALESFEAGAALPDIPHRRHAQKYWQARTLDLLDRRAEAERLYGAVEKEKPYGPLLDAARKRLKSPRAAAKVMPDFIYGDVYAY